MKELPPLFNSSCGLTAAAYSWQEERPKTRRISEIGFCLQRELHCHACTRGCWWKC